jgi:hypothetical protein
MPKPKAGGRSSKLGPRKGKAAAKASKGAQKLSKTAGSKAAKPAKAQHLIVAKQVRQPLRFQGVGVTWQAAPRREPTRRCRGRQVELKAPTEQLKAPTEELSKSSAETQLAGAASQPGPSAMVPGAPLWNAHVGNNLDWAAEVFRRAKAGAAARVSAAVSRIWAPRRA